MKVLHLILLVTLLVALPLAGVGLQSIAQGLGFLPSAPGVTIKAWEAE